MVLSQIHWKSKVGIMKLSSNKFCIFLLMFNISNLSKTKPQIKYVEGHFGKLNPAFQKILNTFNCFTSS